MCSYFDSLNVKYEVAMIGKKWTKEELYLALNLYFKMPFGQMNHTNKRIIQLATLMDRTPSSVSMRLCNFAACDPYLQARGIKGLQAGLPVCQPIWNEYEQDHEKFIYESEQILARYENTSLAEKYGDLYVVPNVSDRQTEIERIQRSRLSQDVFRRMVLKNYANRCAISHIDVKDLLIASHIIPWSQNERERLNPENGICFSALYDKAFDTGLISVGNDLDIIYSGDLKTRLKDKWYNLYFKNLEGCRLLRGVDYQPNPEFLEYHRDVIFRH